MPAFFVPARSSRHRTACFALYRALLQKATAVPLPADVKPSPANGLTVSPVKTAIRTTFRHNRRDTSRRLVHAAMENGKKFLDLLEEAKTPHSEAHQSIVRYLQMRIGAGLLSEKPKVPHATRVRLRKREIKGVKESSSGTTSQVASDSSTPSTSVPLLTRRMIPSATPTYTEDSSGNRIPYQLYEYVPTRPPLTFEELQQTGSRDEDGKEPRIRRRHVPILATDTTGIPFLRLKKPQSPVLSTLIRTKGQKRHERVAQIVELRRSVLPTAVEEDAWERLVREQLKVQEEDTADTAPYRETTYTDGVKVAIDYIQGKLNTEQADMLARSRAMLQIVDAERALAEKEAQEEAKDTQ